MRNERTEGTRHRPRRRPRVAGLLALNGLLLLLLGAVTFGPRAEAQTRARAEYTMIAGGANGALGGVVYIVDVTNQELLAMTYDSSQTEFYGIGYRNLVTDTVTATRGGTNR